RKGRARRAEIPAETWIDGVRDGVIPREDDPADVAKTLYVIKPQPLPIQRLQTRMWAELKSGR
ncbi:MAG: hypothetical protein ACTS5Y_11665, partial [Pollutimonas bauzanensis]